MFTDTLQHQIGQVYNIQTTALLAKQSAISAGSFHQRTGRLAASLQGSATIAGMAATLQYPLHIRFLDMKRSRNGSIKVHAPIYSRPIYGYLVGGVRRYLNMAVPKAMVRAIDGTITSTK